MTRRPTVYRVEAERVSAVEFFVAAEDEQEARRIAHRVAESEVDWWDVVEQSDVSMVRPAHGDEGAESIPQQWLDELGGIWHDGVKGWVRYVDQLDDLPPRPDPNQIAFDLSAL